MKIKHILESEKWEKRVDEEASFLLGNKLGDYLWLSDKPKSRYEGWFFTPKNKAGERLFKVIEDIRPIDREKTTLLENRFSEVVRKTGDFKESFKISEEGHCFLYQINQRKEVELILDMRESYSNDYPDYKIENLGDKILIESETSKDKIFLAVKGFKKVKEVGERFVRHYKKDKERTSPPFEKTVFKAIIMDGDSFLFSVSKNKDEAISNLDTKINFKKIKNRKEPIDFTAAALGLQNLVIEDKRIYAGFPWFFQFWKRDEAISLRGLKIIDKEKAESVFWSLLKEEKDGPKKNIHADSKGWIFKRSFLFLNDFNWEKEKKLAEYLEKEVDFDNGGDLKITKEKETWMDSISRAGARIEIQALQLNMYKLGKIIDKKNEDKYRKIEKELKKKVKDIFWDGEALADGYFPEEDKVDSKIRPNIFLAYYIYPELLNENEWKKCFRKALYELWLDWGGLATVSKKDPRFKEDHTGENAQSYHQGDSWFFINNLAAVSMNRLDDGKFSYEIKKILEASRRDLMWMGAIGHHSELSSASSLKSEGAISQAWSFATYLEAMYEIVKIRNFN